MARVANWVPATAGGITAQWPLIQWMTAPFGTPPNTLTRTAVSTGARGSAIFTSSNSPQHRHFGVVRPEKARRHRHKPAEGNRSSDTRSSESRCASWSECIGPETNYDRVTKVETQG